MEHEGTYHKFFIDARRLLFCLLGAHLLFRVKVLAFSSIFHLPLVPSEPKSLLAVSTNDLS